MRLFLIFNNLFQILSVFSHSLTAYINCLQCEKKNFTKISSTQHGTVKEIKKACSEHIERHYQNYIMRWSLTYILVSAHHNPGSLYRQRYEDPSGTVHT